MHCNFALLNLSARVFCFILCRCTIHCKLHSRGRGTFHSQGRCTIHNIEPPGRPRRFHHSQGRCTIHCNTTSSKYEATCASFIPRVAALYIATLPGRNAAAARRFHSQGRCTIHCNSSVAGVGCYPTFHSQGRCTIHCNAPHKRMIDIPDVSFPGSLHYTLQPKERNLKINYLYF